jgi:hypothetical protein
LKMLNFYFENLKNENLQNKFGVGEWVTTCTAYCRQ